jgi:CrcB protein
MTLALVVLLGAAGSVLRDGVTRRIGRRPRGVLTGALVVNIAGSLLLGVLVARARAGTLSAVTLAALGAGFCGGLTTFSGFALDSVGRTRASAAAYVAVTLVLGLAAAETGLRVAA